MKLFKLYTHIEGNRYDSNVLISMGKRYYFNNEPNGWYIRLELPFTKSREYVSSKDFETKIGPCRKAFLWTKVSGRRKPIHISLWVPINE